MAGRWKLYYKWFSDDAVLQCHFWRPIYEAIINMHCCLFVIGKNLSRNFLHLVQTAVNPKHNFEEVMGDRGELWIFSRLRMQTRFKFSSLNYRK